MNVSNGDPRIITIQNTTICIDYWSHSFDLHVLSHFPPWENTKYNSNEDKFTNKRRIRNNSPSVLTVPDNPATVMAGVLKAAKSGVVVSFNFRLLSTCKTNWRKNILSRGDAMIISYCQILCFAISFCCFVFCLFSLLCLNEVLRDGSPWRKPFQNLTSFA